MAELIINPLLQRGALEEQFIAGSLVWVKCNAEARRGGYNDARLNNLAATAMSGINAVLDVAIDCDLLAYDTIEA